MNKEKVFIEGYEVGFLSGTDGTREKKIQVASGEIVSIDENFIYKWIEPQKPVVPQFVADWIEKCKAKEKSLLNALLYTPEGVNGWVDDPDNQETFALAWIFGYEVEKEKRYIIKLKGVPNGAKFLKYAKVTQKWYFGMKGHYSDREIRHTSKELEEAGFGWIFSCEGIEVEEVE